MSFGNTEFCFVLVISHCQINPFQPAAASGPNTNMYVCQCVATDFNNATCSASK